MSNMQTGESVPCIAMALPIDETDSFPLLMSDDNEELSGLPAKRVMVEPISRMSVNGSPGSSPRQDIKRGLVDAVNSVTPPEPGNGSEAFAILMVRGVAFIMSTQG